jgi:hypothetical protein
MKKITLLFFGLLVFYSCLNNDEPNFTYGFLPIDEVETPTNFTFGETSTITIKYTLPDGCYSFNNLYYEYNDTDRIVAVRSLVLLDDNCPAGTIQEEYKFDVTATQKEDYVFKFWKGTDNQGENIYEEVIVPVN